MAMSDEQLQEQQKLIERAKRDPLAFGELYDAHYDLILNYITRRTGEITTARDITSDTFVKAFRSIHKFQWRGVPFSAWLYRIAGNEIRMYYRRQKPVLSLDDLQDNGFEAVSDIDLQAELEEAQATLDRDADYRYAREIISQLPMRYQEVIALRFGENKKLAEIAVILGKKEGTVKSLLSRALAKIRTEINTQPFAGEGIMQSEGQMDKSREAV